MKEPLGVKIREVIEKLSKEPFYYITSGDVKKAQYADKGTWIGLLTKNKKINVGFYNILNELGQRASLLYSGEGGKLYIGGFNEDDLYFFWYLMSLIMLPIYFSCECNLPRVSLETAERELAGLYDDYAGNPAKLHSDFMKSLSEAEGKKQQEEFKRLLKNSAFFPAEIIVIDVAAYLILKVLPCRFKM